MVVKSFFNTYNIIDKIQIVKSNTNNYVNRN